MLRYLRENTGNWIIKIFLGIIVIVFVFLGVGSMNATRNNQVALVNDEPVTFNEFQEAYQSAVQRMRAQFGNSLNDELLKMLNVKQQALNSLIDQKLLAMAAREMDIQVSDKELQDLLTSQKAFQKDGAFDMALYKRVLGLNSMTPESFEALQRSALKEQKLREMVLSGITVSDAEAMDWYTFQNTKMAIDYIRVNPSDYTDIVPTQDQIKAAYEKNPDQYKSAVQRKAVYLVFSPEDHKGRANITDDQVEGFYNENKDRFSTPEKVEASHILIKVDENAEEADVLAAKKEAETIREKAVAGEDFADLAKSYSQGPSGKSGGYLGVFDRQSMVEPFGNAAFAMKAGDISEPVRTRFGWHVIKLMARFEASVQSLDQAAQTIRKELEGEVLRNMAYDKAGEAFDAVIDGDGFEQIALVAKKELIHTPAFAADGAGLALENAQGFATQAFALAKGEISDVKQLGDKYYLIKVVDEIEPQLLPLTDVQDRIAAALTAEQQTAAAKKAAQDLSAKAGSLKTIHALAQANGLEAGTTSLFTRNQPIDGLPGSQALVSAAFELDREKGVNSKVLEAGGQFYLIGFKEKQVPSKEEAEKHLDRIKEEMAARKQSQYYVAWIQELRDQAEIEINPEVIN